MEITPHNLQRLLLPWYESNKRALPWRKNVHWYSTFLSEVILQQTTVEQGLPYFHRFMETYPNVHALAAANEQDVLKLWAGLGYYARARNMLKTARRIVKKHSGKFPQKMEEALDLPGIGPYSASAILSIAFNQPYAVVDGNVMRVVSRLKNITGDIRKNDVIKKIKKVATRMLDDERPGDFNEAMMELGATVCLPKHPRCEECPLHALCVARKKNLVDKLPYKSKAKAKSKRFQLVLIQRTEEGVRISRRPGNGLLGGMWEFPVIDIPQKVYLEIVAGKPWQISGLKSGNIERSSAAMRHIYSHIDLRYVAIITTADFEYNTKDFYTAHKTVRREKLHEAGLHKAHEKLLKWLEFVTEGEI